jgi:CubicO group peptidase (beta-lactamase class C family)
LLPINKYICRCVILIFIVFFYSTAIASANPFPTKEWPVSTPEEQGMQSQMLADMLEVIEKNSYNVDSVLIIRNGYMVLDAYFYPFSKGLRHPIHSCTKSIMSALIGIAIDKGFVKSVDQPVMDFFPDKLKLEDFGPKIYAEMMRRVGSDIEVLSNKEMTLKCGTRAYRTDIKELVPG